MLPRFVAVAALAALATLLTFSSAQAGPPELPGVEMDEAWADLTFKDPILVTHAKDGSGYVYIVERHGRVLRIKKWDRKGPVPKPTTFLDLRSQVTGVTNAQGGLLGLAFHPQFKTNKRFFVSYLRTNTERNAGANKFIYVIAEYQAAGEKANPRGRALLGIRKTTGLHQAGGLGFGPDGMLYIGVGDNAEKPFSGAAHVSQNVRSPLGKILRIDVDGPKSPGKQYGIPKDNPWPNTPQRVLPELWGYGMRNPWRFSWDDQGRMWTVEPGTSSKVKGPPGSKTQEWVQQIVRGGNHGWPFFEGKRQLVATPPTVNPRSFVPKAFAYEREGTQSTAGIGGYQYRGKAIPSMRGKYVFADYGRGAVYTLDLVGSGAATRGTNWRLAGGMDSITSLGEDEDGEIYICSVTDEGMIWMLLPAS